MPLISKKKAAEINQAASTRGGSNEMPLGVHTMRVTEVRGQVTKKDDPAVVLVFSDGEHRPINEFFVIKDGGKGVEILAGRLQAAGADGVPEAEDLDQLVGFVAKAMLNKSFKVAVRHEERIYEKTETEWYKNANARVAYIGPANEELESDPSKLLRQLSPEDQEKWDAYVARKSGAPAPAKTAATSAAPIDLEDEEEADIEDRIPAEKSSKGESPVKGKKPEAKEAKKAEKEEEEEEEGDDLDLDFEV